MLNVRGLNYVRGSVQQDNQHWNDLTFYGARVRMKNQLCNHYLKSEERTIIIGTTRSTTLQYRGPEEQPALD